MSVLVRTLTDVLNAAHIIMFQAKSRLTDFAVTAKSFAIAVSIALV